MGDNSAVLAGFTREVVATGSERELYLLISPGANLEARLPAWDMDKQEFIVINGWQFRFSEVRS